MTVKCPLPNKGTFRYVYYYFAVLYALLRSFQLIYTICFWYTILYSIFIKNCKKI